MVISTSWKIIVIYRRFYPIVYHRWTCLSIFQSISFSRSSTHPLQSVTSTPPPFKRSFSLPCASQHQSWRLSNFRFSSPGTSIILRWSNVASKSWGESFTCHVVYLTVLSKATYSWVRLSRRHTLWSMSPGQPAA